MPALAPRVPLLLRVLVARLRGVVCPWLPAVKYSSNGRAHAFCAAHSWPGVVHIAAELRAAAAAAIAAHVAGRKREIEHALVLILSFWTAGAIVAPWQS